MKIKSPIGFIIVSNRSDYLNNTLSEFLDSLFDSDKVLLILDGISKSLLNDNLLNNKKLTIIEEEHKGFWGHQHRTKYNSYFLDDPTIQWILNVDDDDYYGPHWRENLDSILFRYGDDKDIFVFNYINIHEKYLFPLFEWMHTGGISPTTSNVLIKNNSKYTNEEWKPVRGGDVLRGFNLITQAKHKVYYSEYALYYYRGRDLNNNFNCKL